MASCLRLDFTWVWSPFCRHHVTEGPRLCWSPGRLPRAHQGTWWPRHACPAPVSGGHPAGGLRWALVSPEGCLLRSPSPARCRLEPQDRQGPHLLQGQAARPLFLGLLMAVAPVQAAMPTTCPPSAWTTSRMSLVETHHPHPTRPQSSVFLLNFSSRGYQRTGRGGARGRC